MTDVARQATFFPISNYGPNFHTRCGYSFFLTESAGPLSEDLIPVPRGADR